MASSSPKRPRRSRGNGSTYQRASDLRWIAEIRDGVKPNGRPNIIRSTEPGFPNDTRENKKRNAEAKEKLEVWREEVRAKIRKGIPVADEVQTVGTFLRHWLEHSAKPSVRTRTYESYESVCRVHIIPVLGHKKLAKLTPMDVQAMMGRMLDRGASPTTVKNARSIFRKALNDAMYGELIGRNVVKLTKMPRQHTFHPKPLTDSELDRFLEAVQGHRLEALWTTLLSLGLREGEAFGLRWEDIDLDSGTLRLRYQIQRIGKPRRPTFVEPKTEKSQRPVPVPQDAIEVLREHQVRQQIEAVIAGSRWKGAEWQNLVFCTTLGTPLDPSNVIKQFREVLESVGMDSDRRVHDLRHTCATMLARIGVPPRDAQEILRHAQIQTTLAVYTHVGDDSLRASSDLWGERMFALRKNKAR